MEKSRQKSTSLSGFGCDGTARHEFPMTTLGQGNENLHLSPVHEKKNRFLDACQNQTRCEGGCV